MFGKWYSLPNQRGVSTTYSCICWHYFRGPDAVWDYRTSPRWTTNRGFDFIQYPDEPHNESDRSLVAR